MPLIVIMSMCALSVSAYGIGNFYLPNYPSILFVYAINLWVYERQAQLLSVTFSNPLIGMLMFLNIWFASFLFNGILVRAPCPLPKRSQSYIIALNPETIHPSPLFSNHEP